MLTNKIKIILTITMLLLSYNIFAQFTGIDIGLGIELPSQRNIFFEVENRPVVITVGGRVNKLAVLRLNHAINNKYEVIHTVSLSIRNEVLYSVANPDNSNDYKTRLESTNLGYSFRVKLFSFSKLIPKSNVELLGGFQGNAYFESDRVTHLVEDEVQENADITTAVGNAFQPTVGLDLVLQSNPKKRLILSIGFHQQLTSYLGSFDYNGNTYQPPKVRLRAYSLLLTYRVFKPKAKKD